MILQALYNYYKRSNGKLPAFGLELKEIGFLIVIDKEGNFIRFEDRRIDKNHAQKFLVKKSVGRSSAPVANYLYDNSAYVFGFSAKNDSEKYLKTFMNKVSELYHAAPNNEDLKAVQLFYQKDLNSTLQKMQQDILWDAIEKNLNKKYSYFSFLIEGDTRIVAEKEELLDFLIHNSQLFSIRDKNSDFPQELMPDIGRLDYVPFVIYLCSPHPAHFQ